MMANNLDPKLLLNLSTSSMSILDALTNLEFTKKFYCAKLLMCEAAMHKILSYFPLKRVAPMQSLNQHFYNTLIPKSIKTFSTWSASSIATKKMFAQIEE